MQAFDAGWVSVEAAAHALDIPASMLRQWCRDGAVESFREGPTQRFVRLDDVREQIFSIRGRPQPSLARLIAGNRGGDSSEARIVQLQELVSSRLGR
jgi:hypothetical protein